jgi:hypothetical protein
MQGPEGVSFARSSGVEGWQGRGNAAEAGIRLRSSTLTAECVCVRVDLAQSATFGRKAAQGRW